jgi:mono/diheme cytochrome c family protein
MLHLSELHGAATHLAVVAIPLYAIVLIVRRTGAASAGRRTGTVFLAGGAVGVLLVVAQRDIGGRMTYDQGVGIQAGGQLAQTAIGTARLERALATGQDRVQAGRAAFSESGAGCASCHGDQAQGDRGPRLAGGAELPDFRRVHATGLFPPQVVSDADFEAIDAYLRTLGPARRRR